MIFHPNARYKITDRNGNAVVIEFRRGERSGWYIDTGWLGVIAGTRPTPVDIRLARTCVEDGDLRVERVSL